MTSQSNDIMACEIGKSHVALSHGQNLSYIGNVRNTSHSFLHGQGRSLGLGPGHRAGGGP
jgi:hypothetical protein